MSDLRVKLIRMAHCNPALRPHLLPLLRRASTRLRDVPDADDLFDGFRRITKVWSSESDADQALRRLLDQNGLREAYRGSGVRDSQKVFLETMDGEPIADPLVVFYRPGPRPGWTSFQVST